MNLLELETSKIPARVRKMKIWLLKRYTKEDLAQVNLNILNMTNHCLCIGGQLEGSYGKFTSKNCLFTNRAEQTKLGLNVSTRLTRKADMFDFYNHLTHEVKSMLSKLRKGSNERIRKGI